MVALVKKTPTVYALRDINKPIGVSGYLTKALESLPKKFKSSLPTIEDIETEFITKKPKKLDTKSKKTSKK